MVKKTQPSVIEREIESLEEKVEALLGVLDRLMIENRSLRRSSGSPVICSGDM